MGAYLAEEGYKGYSVVTLTNKYQQVVDIKDGRNKPSGLFEDVASCFIVVTHVCLEKLVSLPFPLGAIMEAVEEAVAPFAQPVEDFMLPLLTGVDNQIYAVFMNIERTVASTSERVNLILALLRKRGVVRMSADFWVLHESSIREGLQRALDLVNRIPLVGVATPFVCAISAPVLNTLSDWLVEHSQSQDKTIQFHQEEGKKLHKMDTDFSGITHGVKLDVKGNEEAKPVDTKKDAIEGDIKDVKESEKTNTQDVMGGWNNEEQTKEEDTDREEVAHKERDASEVNAVLEMIDSGWLLGAGGPVSPRSQVAAPSKAPSNPKKQTTSSKSKRGLLSRSFNK